jgi:hypothetical protein
VLLRPVIDSTPAPRLVDATQVLIVRGVRIQGRGVCIQGTRFVYNYSTRCAHTRSTRTRLETHTHKVDTPRHMTLSHTHTHTLSHFHTHAPTHPRTHTRLTHLVTRHLHTSSHDTYGRVMQVQMQEQACRVLLCVANVLLMCC